MHAWLARLASSFRIVGWFYRDAVWRYPIQTITIIALDTAAIAVGGATVGATIQGARAISAGRSITIPGTGVELDTGVAANVIAFGMLLFGVGVIGAATLWVTQRLIRRTAAQYHSFCIERALDLTMSGRPAFWTLSASDRSTRSLLRFCIMLGPQLLNRCFMQVLQSVRHSILLLVTAVALIIINWALALVLLPLGAIYLMTLTVLSERAVDSDSEYRAARDKFRRGCVELIRQVMPEPDAKRRSDRQDDIARRGGTMTQRLARRRLIVSRMQFVNSVFYITTAAFIFAYYGIGVSRQDTDWTSMILFMVCLRLFIGGLRNNSAMLVRLHLYAQRLDPYFELVRTSATEATAPRVSVPDLTGPPSSASGSPVDDSPAPPVTVLLTLPWRPTTQDLDLAEALLIIGDDERSPVVRHRRVTAENAARQFADLADHPDVWLICRVQDWTDVLEAAMNEGDEGRPMANPVLLVTALTRKLENILRQCPQRDITKVMIWAGGAIREHGEWDWYAAEWTRLTTTFGIADSDDESADLDDDDF